MTIYSVQLPENLYRLLQRQAAAERRSVDEWVQQSLTRQLPPIVPIEDELPLLLREELQAMEHLSDAALWALARSTLTAEQLNEMDQLHEKANEGTLTKGAEMRRKTLLLEYEETVLRRAHAAVLLKSRGYDLSDPSILYQP